MMAQDLNRHPDEGELEKYSMADLREEAAAGFEEHLLHCEHCQRRLAETDAYVAAMRRAAAQLSNQQMVREWLAIKSR
jgi:anti-sigma factor RsiW